MSPLNRRSSLEDEFERDVTDEELEDEKSPPRVHFSDENGKTVVSPPMHNRDGNNKGNRSKRSGGSRGGPDIPVVESFSVSPQNVKSKEKPLPMLGVGREPMRLAVNY